MATNPSIERLLVLGGALLCALPVRAQQNAAAQAKQVENAVAADAGKRALKLLKILPAQDIDGDGKDDVVAALHNESEEVVVSLYRVAQGRVTHAWTSPTTGGTEVLDFQEKQLAGDKNPEVILEVREKSPDEVRRVLRIFGADKGGMRELLQLGYPETEKEVRFDQVSYGDADPGFRMQDVDNDGNQDVVIKREPKVVKVPSDRTEPMSLIIGVRESIFAYDARAKKYVEKGDRQVNFLPSLKLRRVKASSQKLPKDLAEAEQDKALEAGLELDDDSAGGEKSNEPDPAPRAFWATDNNPDTGWTENSGSGEGEWIELTLKEAADIKMIRMVPVCAIDEKTAKGNNDIVVFSAEMGAGARVTVDRKEKVPSDSQVAGVLEVPMPDRKFAPQVLVFLKKGVRASSVKIVLDKVKKKSKANEACIGELSIH